MNTMSDAVAAAMVELWDFAADAGTYIPAVGDPVSVQVRIDKQAFVEPDGLTTVVAGEEIRAKVLLADIGQEPVARTPQRKGDVFEVGDIEYEVTAIVEKDNHFITCAVKEI